MSKPTAVILAGVPAHNHNLYHRIRFDAHDPAVLIEIPGYAGSQSILILRDIEMERARKRARAGQIACPRDFEPAGGLSGDRETATAQAAAECLRRKSVRSVRADRTLALSYADALRKAGIEVVYDPELGAAQRRAKDEQELAWIREAQAVTEDAVRLACETVARAQVDGDGSLLHEGKPLTSERVRALVDVCLIEAGYSNPGSIVSGGPQGADCHLEGSGPLYTGQPVIVDIFPCCRATKYHGDCTRTVVHGAIPAAVAKMHAAVVEAKAAAIARLRAGISGEAVHAAAGDVIARHGYPLGLPPAEAPVEWCGMVHGTGHGIGLDLHEPPLLDRKGPALVAGDVVTVEPGLYSKALGGVRVEDMLAVTERGCENFNSLPEGLEWA